MAYVVKSAGRHVELPHVSPLELVDNITGTAPAGMPIMSTCFIVEKMNVAISDGNDGWYANDDNGSVVSITAGQSWAELFG